MHNVIYGITTTRASSQLPTNVVSVLMQCVFGLLGTTKLVLTFRLLQWHSHSNSHVNESVSWNSHSANVNFDQFRHIPSYSTLPTLLAGCGTLYLTYWAGVTKQSKH